MSRIIRHDATCVDGAASASVVSLSGVDRGVARGARWRFVAAIIGAAAGAVAAPGLASAQEPPYDVRPAIAPPYWRVRFEAATAPDLVYPATFTVWIPPGVHTLRGVVVHQHGCGTGSCSGGFTAAHDLHWQALAARHGCALLAPVYEQPDKADCQAWCDPRNGSARRFRQALDELGVACGHPELATVPWALWGHSGGGHWVGGMTLLFPERVVAAWLRSGVPLLEADADRPGIKAHALPEAALAVPMLVNLGVKEGVSGGDERFAGVWPANRTFFHAVRSRGGLVGVAIDPLSSHDCGNQRYLAIPWLDACLAARLPATPGEPLRPIDTRGAWLAPITGGAPLPAAGVADEALALGWLPDEATARRWNDYVRDTRVADDTPPPAPRDLRLVDGALEWDASADLESGLAGFVVERDGTRIATLPEQPRNPFGRPLFQNLLYSDTPSQPLVPLRFVDPAPVAGTAHAYRVIAVNTVGLESPPSAPVGR